MGLRVYIYFLIVFLVVLKIAHIIMQVCCGVLL